MMAITHEDSIMSLSELSQTSPQGTNSAPRTIGNIEDTSVSEFPRSQNRHHSYTYRLPNAPRIIVPPPTLTSEMPELNVSMAESNVEEVDTSFLKEMNLESIIQKNTLLEWAYERRREAQMILPWLYLGPLSAAKDKNFLTKEGITMAIVVRTNDTSMNGAVDFARGICQEVASIEAPNYYALIPQFSRTTRMINQHIAKVRQITAAAGNPQMGKVLVFCESGNEKSASVVAAYLMDMMENFDYVQAMQICQAQRFCVNFDDTIKTILRSHWDILSARRTVASSHADTIQSNASKNSQLQVQPAFSSKPKRSIEETADEDIEMDDGTDPSDLLRFGGRDNTPFRDT